MSLKREFNKTALLVIDVQPPYCAPRGWHNVEAAETAERLAKRIPVFRRLGLPVYVVYTDKRKQDIKHVEFYAFEPDSTDIPIAKNDDSAFKGSNIDKVLRGNGHNHLLVTGFNHNACVFRTVMDALRKGYDVDILKDLTGNETINDPFGDEHESYSRIMAQKGAKITNSAKVLKKIKGGLN